MPPSYRQENVWFLKLGFDQSGLPSPSVNLHFRWCLDEYLLSLENIIQRFKRRYIKISIQNRKLICNDFHATFIISLSLCFVKNVAHKFNIQARCLQLYLFSRDVVIFRSIYWQEWLTQMRVRLKVPARPPRRSRATEKHNQLRPPSQPYLPYPGIGVHTRWMAACFHFHLLQWLHMCEHPGLCYPGK